MRESKKYKEQKMYDTKRLLIMVVLMSFCVVGYAATPFEFETPAMPDPIPDTWLTYHLAHPGPEKAIPGDAN
ncbi:MAG: hypothetical protein ACYSUT_11040, partial [Planctomycetota bacterium]